ncbi:hypothetical protein [Rhizorhabdus sp.]|uniref:hypothetical protein n=1 Tax=Rhizorhabdus sp. TaxID=1968843 RepID=UPI0035B1C669
MNGLQIFTSIFAVTAMAVSLTAIVAVLRSDLRHKWLWVIGSLVGFIGPGINWTVPDDIALLFGVSIPPVMVFKLLAAGQWYVKTGFPIVAIVALARSRSGSSEEPS